MHNIARSQDDDEVFIAPPTPSPPPPPLPYREIEIMEDFPPPPPLTPPVDEDVGLTEISQHPLHPISSDENLTNATAHPEPEPPTTNSSTPPVSPLELDASEILGSDCHLLSRRERTHTERLVETLARELVKHDKSLTSLLDTWAGKTTLDLMEDIFPSHRTSSGHLDNRAQDIADSQTPPRKMETNLDDEEAYLNQKKVELLQALRASVQSLREERESLAEQQQVCAALGGSTEALVQERCKSNEKEKFRMFVGDLEKIVNLLLSLSARLARVENSLSALQEEEEHDDEKESLQLKQKQLRSQQEDARELKENLDRRERVVLDILAGYLSVPQLHDYQRFIRMKPALLIRQRHLDELIRQGEEQTQRLEESLPLQHHPKNTDSAPRPTHTLNSTHLPRPTTVTSL